MLAPVIFISLRCAAVATANALGGSRLERSAAPINIYSRIIFSGIFFPTHCHNGPPATVHRFNGLPIPPFESQKDPWQTVLKPSKLRRAKRKCYVLKELPSIFRYGVYPGRIP